MTERVLLIDDSIPLHKLIHAQMPDLGVDVYSAYDGQSGLEMAAEIRPNVILLDIDLPEMDGFEVCKHLKANGETAAIPVIFLTADATAEDKVKGLELGAVEYVTKPFKIEELNARIRAVRRVTHEAEQRAMIDGLTGLWNKSYLEDHLAAKIAESQGAGQPLSCITVEVDGMEAIERHHGRVAGDEVTRSVSQALLAECRATDAICHAGHGKFVIVLSGSDRHAGGRVAQRLCETLKSRVVHRNGVEVAMSCSFGVADSFIAGEKSLLERAAAALRRAKFNGNASVSVARPERRHGSGAAAA